MARIQLDLHSDVLGKAMSATVILPQKNNTLIGMKTEGSPVCDTLWLLHGLSDDHTIWSRRTSIERYASERGIAVVMPGADRSWYTDMKYGGAYFTYLTEELPAVCRSLFRCMSADREHNLIAGLSMGGYGAMKAALTYPDRYRAAASLSGALDLNRYIGGKDPGDNPEWYAILGNFADFENGPNDLFAVARRAAFGIHPDLFLWCGTEDGLLGDNRRFVAHLKTLGIFCEYRESEGDHSWQYWDKHIQSALSFFFDPPAEGRLRQ